MTRYGVLIAALLFAYVPGAFAQSGAVAQLTGVVTDESGGVLPGVEVTVTQTNTGMTRFVITGARGEYLFTNLPIGPYRLGAKLEESGAHLRLFQRRHEVGIHLPRNRVRRARRRHERKPGTRHQVGQAELGRGRHVGCD